MARGGVDVGISIDIEQARKNAFFWVNDGGSAWALQPRPPDPVALAALGLPGVVVAANSWVFGLSVNPMVGAD